MVKKRELTEEEIKELLNWDIYSLDCIRLLKDDKDVGLDSYFRASFSIYIKPNKNPDNIHMRKLINFFRNVKKEKTLSHEEMPNFFKSFYFDELHIEKMERDEMDAHEDIAEHCHIFEHNSKKGYPVILALEIEMNASGRYYREDTKRKRYLTNFFGIDDFRFRHFLDSLSLFNEIMPLYAISRPELIAFFNGLEQLKNHVFKFENPDFKDGVNTVSGNKGKVLYKKEFTEKYRFKIPFTNIKFRENINDNIKTILTIRNDLWNIIYPRKDRNLGKYYWGRFLEHPFYEYLLRLLDENYDYELEKQKIAITCWCCGDMFKYKKGKKYCSLSSEGKDCGKKYRNYNDYFRHREKRKKKSKKYMSSYRKLLKKHGISSKNPT